MARKSIYWFWRNQANPHFIFLRHPVCNNHYLLSILIIVFPTPMVISALIERRKILYIASDVIPGDSMLGVSPTSYHHCVTGGVWDRAGPPLI